MITKRSKVYVSYLYMWVKYKSVTVYMKNEKKKSCLHITVSKGTLHFKYVSK